MNIAEFKKQQLEKDYDERVKNANAKPVISKTEFVKKFLQRDLNIITDALNCWSANAKKEYKKRFLRIEKDKTDLENLIKTL